jgi:hypothetical protein
MSLRENILRDGFVIIPNLLSAEEITKLRHLVTDHMKTDMPNNYSYGAKAQGGAMPELGWLYYHPKVLSFMKELLQTDNVMFTSHCDVHSRLLSSWHKGDGSNSRDINSIENLYFDEFTYGVDDCRVYKMAIYLQDHFYNLGGLRVRRNSHCLAGVDQGEEIYLKTKAGNAIVFDVRLTHSGQTDLVPLPFLDKPISFCLSVIGKVFRTSFFHIALRNFYDRIAGDKMSIFFTYGFPNDYTVKFARNNMRRQIGEHPELPIYLPEALRQKLVENQVLLAEDYFSDLKPPETGKY